MQREGAILEAWLSKLKAEKEKADQNWESIMGEGKKNAENFNKNGTDGYVKGYHAEADLYFFTQKFNYFE